MESDHIFREEFLGDWLENEKEFSCRIDTAENKKYLISLFADLDFPGADSSEIKIDSSYFEAFLIQYSGQYYLDCSPAIKRNSLDKMGEYAKAALLPLHRIFKVDMLSKDRLVISGINRDSLEKYLPASAVTIKKDLMDEDNIILTDQPGKLQKNILQNKKAKFIFSDSFILNRKS